jgi:hypothetical protein
MNCHGSESDLTRRAVLGMTAAAGIPHLRVPHTSTRILIMGGRGSRDILGDVRQAVGNAFRRDVRSLHLVRVGDQILVQVVTSDATTFYALGQRDFKPESCGCGHRPASPIEGNVHCFVQCGDLHGICARLGILAGSHGESE